MRHLFKDRRQSGDTIVEVMIAIAVVSTILVTAYATTNKNVISTQDAQEHSQALQLVQSQVELLRSNPAGVGIFCYYIDSVTHITASYLSTNAKCSVDGSGQPTVQEPVYNLSVSGSAATVYQVNAAWTSASGTKANVTMYYRP